MVKAVVSQEAQLWAELNHQYLLAAIAQLKRHLQPEINSDPLPESLHPPAAIERLCDLFGLSPFERTIVLLCAGVELHREIVDLLVTLHHDSQATVPTFGIVLHHFPHNHWSAFTPGSPLRRWLLVELGASSTLINSPLRLDERILHFLLGDTQLDSRLTGIVAKLPTDAVLPLPQSQRQLVVEIVNLLQQCVPQPVIQLCGYDSAAKQMIAAAVGVELECGLLHLATEVLPPDFDKLNLVQTLWERESLLTGSLLLLDCDHASETSEANSAQYQQGSAISRLMDTCQQAIILLSRDRRSCRQRAVVSFEVTPPTAAEQRQLWMQALAAVQQEDGTIATQVNQLVAHFNLSPLAIQTIATQSFAKQTGNVAESSLLERLWQTCLTYARPRLEELAQPISTQVSWADLVLPEKEKQTLWTIVAQVQQRAKVYEQWGFAGKGQRGLGISALFAGASGTGKTLAAEVLANELQLNLYRIDLSAVTSKYIGETEKNLRRIFDSAEVGGAILLFDEADALFGKRSEVKDSHDRYANMEVSYLLQRIESYQGLAILTTNLKNSLDQAFLRRLRFVVQFPFPDATQRTAIWQRVFPAQTPTKNLIYPKLAKLNLPGGNIRNIALNAAFLAANADSPVQMQHILQAAQSEYIKLEKPLTETEIKGWI